MPAPLFAFHSDEKISHGFFRVLGAIKSEAESLSRSQRPPHEAAHEGRILIKRTRALLWLAKPALTEWLETQSKTELRRASKLLAGQRDRLVTTATLEKLEQSVLKFSDRVALQETLQRLSRKEPEAAAEKKSLEAAMRILCRLIAVIKSKTPTTAKWPSFSKRIAKAEQAAQKAGKKAKKTKADLDFHNWRKKAKRLLYDLELTAPLVPGQPRRRLILYADKLQDRLGQYQDCVVVEKRLQNRPHPRVAKLLSQRKKLLQKKSRKTARRLDEVL